MYKSFTINDLPSEERPRERLVKLGEQALSGQELIQLILGRGVSGESVSTTAQKMLSKFGSLQKLSEASLQELSSIRGIGIAKATQIKAVFEIHRRLATQTVAYQNAELSDPEKVYRLIKNKLVNYQKEHFYIIALDSRNHSIVEVSVGSLNESIVHPREVFAEAITNRAASVIFAHNHPSGDPGPSENDIKTTQRLVEIGNLLDITVLDHIIIGKDKWFSFQQQGMI